MSKKLEILKNSLLKKEAELSKKISLHIEDVRRANGQPLNDKRNGHVTLNRWERQNDSIRALKGSIQKTKRAIEFEEGQINGVALQNEKYTPKEILELIEKGELIQWRKHPHTFFVSGVDKARIWWDEKRKAVAHKYAHLIINVEQRKKFVQIYNSLNAKLNK